MMCLLPSVLTSSLSGIQVNPTSKTFPQSVSFYLYRYRPNTSTIFWASVNSFLIGFPASTLAPILHSTARVTGSIKYKSDLSASHLATLPCLLIALGLKSRPLCWPTKPWVATQTTSSISSPTTLPLPPLSLDSNHTGLCSTPQTHWICSCFKGLIPDISCSWNTPFFILISV